MQSYHVQVFEVRPVSITSAMRIQMAPDALHAKMLETENRPLRDLWMMQEGPSANEAKHAVKEKIAAALRAYQPAYDLVSIAVVENPQRIKVIVRRK